MAAPHSLSSPSPPSVTPEELTARKAALRARARAIRAGLDPAAAGAAVARWVLRQGEFADRRGNDAGFGAPAPGTVVAGFWPMRDEIDLRPLWHGLHAAECLVVLPETPPRGQPLVFRAWSPDMEMVAERFGTLRPAGPPAMAGSEAGPACEPALIPALIFVPFLAFDRACHRLGYGGGYYDRTLAALPGVRAVGLGFSALAVDSLPVGPHDHALDAVITELGVTVPILPEA
jgi:5-formyltetrahydrofolate cyclo-ligase